MKCLLVVKSKFMENLGVMYLSSVIKQAGHECRIAELKSNTVFYDAWQVAVDWLPDIIGYSIMTGDRERFKEFNDKVIEMYGGYGSIKVQGFLRDKPVTCPVELKKPKIIVGGPDPTFFPKGYGWADTIIRGEGENFIDRYVNYYTQGSGDKYPDINSIPWPDRTDYPNMKIRDFIASRGCPYSCSYCFNAHWNRMFPDQKQVRVRSVDDVVAEIKHVNPEYVYFQDSCFGVSMDWMREFAIKYKRVKDYDCWIVSPPPYQCHLRPEMVNEERVRLLKSSGCVAVRIALESASNRLRSLIGRHKTKLEQVRVASKLLREAGIQLMLQNILGLPSSTIEDDLFTLEMNIKYKPTYAWASIFVPYPGTDLGDYCKETGIYKGDYSEISDSFFDTSYLDFTPEHKEQLEILQKVFALCVDYGYMPKVEELTYKMLPRLVHKITRKAGDSKLYLGLL